MAIAYDHSSSALIAPGTTPTLLWSHTCSGSNRLLVVAVAVQGNNPVTGVTYGGVALTQELNLTGANANAQASLWRLVNPAAGTANIIVSVTQGGAYPNVGTVATAHSYTGVDQTAPIGNKTSAAISATSISVTLATNSSQLVVDGMAKRYSTETPSPGAGQGHVALQRSNVGADWLDVWGGSSDKAAGAASTTMSWSHAGTGRHYVLCAMALNPLVTALSVAVAESIGVTESQVFTYSVTGRSLAAVETVAVGDSLTLALTFLGTISQLAGSPALVSLVTIYGATGTRYVCDQETDLFPTFVQQLAAPLDLTYALPDRANGIPQSQRATLHLSNILRSAATPTLSAWLSQEDLLGQDVHAEIYDTVDQRSVMTLDGVIVEIPTLTDDTAEITVESLNTDLFDTSVPRQTILDVYPNADVSLLRDTNAVVRVPFGIMPQVDLALVLTAQLACAFTIGPEGTGDKYIYMEDTSVPNLTVTPGMALVYDIYATWDAQIALGLFDETTLLWSTGAKDQNGLDNYAGTDINAYAAVGKWYRRVIPLPSVYVGKTITRYLIGCEQDTAGTYIAWIANAAIIDASGAVRVSIFNENTTPTYDTLLFENPPSCTASFAKFSQFDYGTVATPYPWNNYALAFTGTGGITFSNAEYFNFTTLTAEVWFRTNTLANYPALFGRAASSGNQGWMLNLSPVSGLVGELRTVDGIFYVASLTTPADNVWHCATLVIDDTAKIWALYQDGTLQDQKAFSGTWTASGGPLRAAFPVFAAGAYTGALTEIRLWNRALSPGEVLGHYDDIKTGQESGLAGYWPLRENGGTILTDLSPNGNAGTVTNGTWGLGPDQGTLFYNVYSAVYRDGAVVPRDQWQPGPWGNWRNVRFNVPQYSAQGRTAKIQADIISPQFERNAARVAQYLLSDSTYGVGAAVDTESFALAAARYQSLIPPTGYLCDGGLAAQIPLRDVLRELLVHGAVLWKTPAQAFALTVDTANYALGCSAASSQYVTVGNWPALSFPNNIFTIEFWLHAFDTTTLMGILRKRIANAGEEYAIWCSSGGTLEFRAWSYPGFVVYQVNATYDTTWTHFAWVGTGTGTILYKNGVQVATAAKGTANMSAGPATLELGRSIDNAGSGVQYLNGHLDEVRFWSVARTQQQILDNMNQPLMSLPASLAAYWPFDTYGSPTGQELEFVSGNWSQLVNGAAWAQENLVTWDDSALELGDGDYATTGWGNILITGETQLALSQRIATLTLNGALKPAWQLPATFTQKSARTLPNDTGKTQPEENDYLYDWQTIDHEVYYQLQRRYYARQSLEVSAHRSLRYLQAGQRLLVHAPNRPNIDGKRYEIAQRHINGETYALTLLGWDARIYQHALGAGQGPQSVPVVNDYTQTRPDAPTGFTFVHDSFTTGSTITVDNLLATATAPLTPNVTGLIFRLQSSGGVAQRTVSVQCRPGAVVSALFDQVVTGQTYYCTCYAYAAFNSPTYQEGINAGPLSLAN